MLTFAIVSFFLSIISVQAESIKVAVTTSFNNSGLSSVLLPEIKNDIGLEVQLLVVGTGQALKLGRSGDVDAILVHSKDAEMAFISNGFGIYRRQIMYNDFVIIGPAPDPAGISEAKTALSAFEKIASSGSAFISRGDDSGTHRKEIFLWQSVKLDPEKFDPMWYREAGAGMGATLNTASGMNAYLISDRASWLKFGNRGDLKLLFEGDKLLFNQYAFLPVNPQKHVHVKYDLAKTLEAWLVSPKAQKMIADYKINEEALFVPNANQSKENE